MENFEDNIEKEYHERFRDFEEMPDDAVWNKIQERIAPEPERRPIVFWWNNYRSMGIAASVLLGLTVGGYLFSTFNDNKEQQSISDNTKSTPVGENKQTTKSTRLLKENQSSTTTIQKQQIVRKDANNRNFSGSKETLLSPEQEKTSILDEKLALNSEVKNQLKNAETKNSIAATNEGVLVQESIENISSLKSQIPTETKVSEMALQSSTIQSNGVELVENFNGNNTYQAKNFTIDLPFLVSKSTDIRLIIKELKISEVPQIEPVFAFEEPRRERLVFIPPTEIYANVSPMLNYYVFSPNKTDNFVVKDFNGSSDRLSFAAQMGVVYPLSKKMDIRTGLSFMTGKSNISYGLTNINQKTVKVIDEHSIEVQPTKSMTTEQRNWQYLEIQSDLLYAIKKLQALSLGFRAGVQTSAIDKPIFNGRIGYRISKPVNNRVALWLEPSVVISLSSQASLNNHFLYRTTGFSLNMGVSLLRNE